MQSPEPPLPAASRADLQVLAPDPGPDHRLQTLCLMTLAALAVGVAAWWLRDVLVPFVFAVFLTFALRPLIDVLNGRLGLPRGLATVLTLVVGVLALIGLAAVVSASVMQLTQSGEDYQARIGELLERVMSWPLFRHFGVDPHRLLSSLADSSVASFGQVLGALFNSLFSLASHSVVVLIYLVFLLFGASGAAGGEGVWRDIRSSIEQYLGAKVVLSLAVGALTWLILNLLGVQLALVFGLLAFVLNFIPNVGPIVATFLPLPVVLLAPDFGLGTAALAILLPGAVHVVVGHLLEPRIMGHSLDLDPVVVLLALMLAGVVWGPMGMLLATPMTAVARILLERVELTRPVAAVMAGRPSAARGPQPEEELPGSQA